MDDDRITRSLLQRLLVANGYTVQTAENGREAVEKLEQHAFHLVLTDWSMPEMDGEALCRWVRARETEHYVYLIILTSNSDKAHLKRGFEAGADDYVTKPFDNDELLARLRVGHRILDLQARAQKTERLLRQIADRDGLTDLLNRRALDARMSEAFSYFQRRGRPLSVALVDLDHFKQINDTHGHPAGDAVLQEVAQRLAEVVRDYDTVGRYGGEEFMLILPDTVAWSARLVAERVRAAVAEAPVPYQALELAITASVGVATIDFDFHGELTQLVEVADEALYEAKRRGRNRVVSLSLQPEGEPKVMTTTVDLTPGSVDVEPAPVGPSS